MPRETFSQQQVRILQEIWDKYHFDSGIRITGDRHFIHHRPERLVKLHNGFGYLTNAYIPPGKEGDYIRELKQVHKALKIEYLKIRLRRNLHATWYRKLF